MQISREIQADISKALYSHCHVFWIKLPLFQKILQNIAAAESRRFGTSFRATLANWFTCENCWPNSTSQSRALIRNPRYNFSVRVPVRSRHVHVGPNNRRDLTRKLARQSLQLFKGEFLRINGNAAL